MKKLLLVLLFLPLIRCTQDYHVDTVVVPFHDSVYKKLPGETSDKDFWQKGGAVIVDTFPFKGLDKGGYIFYDTTSFLATRYDIPIEPPLDTIPCIMLVCDTAALGHEGIAYDKSIDMYMKGIHNNNVWWQKGYSVREIDYYFANNYEKKKMFTHLYYLDSDKKKLSKNIVVWFLK
jgi:hypothetical protein